jgi:hypothetical protein
MNLCDNQIRQLTIRELLNEGVDYLIPMYQRNYAWDEGEITQLIQDVLDYLPKGGPYYLGTLVVFNKKGGPKETYETIDGQQRLTTLSLLASFLKNNLNYGSKWYSRHCVHFENRPRSQKTFTAIFEGKFDGTELFVLPDEDTNEAILNGYKLIKKLLPQKLRENTSTSTSPITIGEFGNYLLDKVQIIRTTVPDDTDLNHYFEIMNNRGEQLEKHEILKARLLDALNGIIDADERSQSQTCLSLIWEACANMERYVQMGFSPSQRDAIFLKGDWGQFLPQDFNDLSNKLIQSKQDVTCENTPEIESAQSIEEIILLPQSNFVINDGEKEVSERFNTVINFPNFLLQVLRVHRANDLQEYGEDQIPLDDKRLLPTFENSLLRTGNSIERVKQFAFALLKCKFLFDKFILKREFLKGADGWSLKRLACDSSGGRNERGRPRYVNTFGSEMDGDSGYNRRILMLLSAFHVSTPTQVYKHWLNAALYYLCSNQKPEIEADNYLSYLESVAKSFVFDRFLRESNSLNYYEIIYNNRGACITKPFDISENIMAQRLSFGQYESNFIFNFLDYLLWLQNQKESKVKDYEFTFRSSVEHYYPQHPKHGFDPMPPEILNSFGNLCLISHSKNSSLSNNMPEAKKEYYAKNAIDSIKQYLMMKYEVWNENSVRDHYLRMKEVFLASLESLSAMEEN